MSAADVDAYVTARTCGPEAGTESAGSGTAGAPPVASVSSVAVSEYRYSWPPLSDRALHGLVGEAVRVILPSTEADRAALLVQLLVALGNCIGRGPHVRVEQDRHGLNLNALVVGESARARKGTSWGWIAKLVGAVDPDWQRDRIAAGLSSGEGFVTAVRDPIIVEGDNGAEVRDAGVTDKRLLVREGEFGRVLDVMSREGNTLSAHVRDAWDGLDLQVRTKAPMRATEPHVSIIGHITREELQRKFSAVEMANGFGNRFLFACVRRSKLLPRGGTLRDNELGVLVGPLTEAVDFARRTGELTRDDGAWSLWERAYPILTADRQGLVGGLTARAEAQVVRIAALYAVLDLSRVIRAEHLGAALSLWRYCHRSVGLLFGESLGDPVADELLRALRATAGGMTRTEIRDHFARHKRAHEIDGALSRLAQRGLVRMVTESTAGRSAERWYATQATKATGQGPSRASVASVASPGVGHA